MSPTYGAGPAPAIADSGARKVAVLAGEPDGQASRPTSYQIQAIRAELIGSSTCSAAGITARRPAPVLALCRQLLAAGLDPDQALEVYRGATLALRIRSIGEGAQLTVAEGDRDPPRLRPWKPFLSREGAPPIAPNDCPASVMSEAAE